ncbi:sulfite exporter TauE/SafE family protein [Ramlibacter aquaticus]|uniref:Probable membrane transporter protein n=1 Tax=Ramlibacter aquaticus TaxID=2780094 RepID=A0ABR9SCL8_9BURK|nr:sulfite exporter TauE/SafE family protein [Ramlibacter aquaticus]MBE7939589.1 sulfite exporter TauE/SafE family protein [Ramlibacter aquaticus]
MAYTLVLLLGLAAGTLGGIVGFGSSIMLMPALVLMFGPRQAVPIMAIASLMANVSRVAAWWREVDWRTVAAYSATAVPGAALGARTLLALPMGWVEGLLGLFFVAMVPVRRWMQRQHWQLHRGHMAAVGAVIGFLTGVVVSTGPLNTPFFLMHGLVRGPFLATEAMSSVPVYLGVVLLVMRFRTLAGPSIHAGLRGGAPLQAA